MDYITPNWPAPPNIKALTTVRTLWGSYAIHPRGEQSNALLKPLLHLPEDPIWVHQTHSNIALPALPESKGKVADAIFTTLPQRVCGVLTTDCLPILICNQEGTEVAAIHAGWRGLAGGIIESTIAHLISPQQDLMAWLGPAISQQKYEVGIEVYEAFTNQYSEATLAFIPQAPQKWLVDLYALARMRLTLQGITAIYGGDFCTYTQDDLFFSNRRDKGIAGSMASLIWID